MKFTNRTRTTMKLSFVKFPTVKYNISENTNREIIITFIIIHIIYDILYDITHLFIINRCVISYNIYI